MEEDRRQVPLPPQPIVCRYQGTPPASPPHTLQRPSYQPPTSHTRVPLARATPLCTQDKWRNICKKRAATLACADSLTGAALAAQGFCTCTVANGGTRSGTSSGTSSGRGAAARV